MLLRKVCCGAVLALLFVPCAVTWADEDVPEPQPSPYQPRQPRQPRRPQGGPSGRPVADDTAKKDRADGIKKYDDVITKDAETQAGVFAVHKIKDKIYFEIPEGAFGRLMMWQAEIAKGSGRSWGGMSLGNRFLRWERRDNKVFLWEVKFRKRAEGRAIQTAVDAANQDAIIAVFPVEAEGKDRSTVILATSMFLSNKISKQPSGIDGSRSYLVNVKAFPQNIEVRSMLTTSPDQTDLVHYSLNMLPQKPMRGRLVDSRVGYFTESFEKYDDPKMWMVQRSFITRFRLEKKDPSAEVSEPVHPITFYLSREIPEKWRPYLKKGVEDWKPAFEAAGFKNAIICREAPERAEDPNWDPEDSRYSVIRWVASGTANAMGPHVHDPRSGEIISAHIIFWHNIIELAQMWYFLQCSAVDSRARRLPLPDELTGECLRYVAAHEVGHTLGLRHNHRASQAYTIQQLRDPKFTADHGSVASIMSYGRFNYVAQPEDGVKHMLPIIAPYDIFAISWGYKPIPKAKSAEDERQTLDEWAARQIKEPWLRFGGEDGPAQVDPSVLTENIGSDPVQATALGLKNLDRVMDHLAAATTTKGENFDLLKKTYQELLSHRSRWFGAVAKMVGGVVEQRTLAGRGGATFTRVPKEKQKEAVKFLLEQAFTTPTRLLDPAMISLFHYQSVASGIQSQQRGLLQGLLSRGRLERLSDAELLDPNHAYTQVELVNDLQAGLWSELRAETPKIDPLRRQLQETFLEMLTKEFESAPAAAPQQGPRQMPGQSGGGKNSELRAIARAALRDLAKQINTALPQVKDAATRLHLEDALCQIDLVLETKKK